MVKIKTAQLPHAGYKYQDLMGLMILIEWIKNPNLYRWVRFDHVKLDEKDIGGLDDITALKTDGSYVLRQVKFTIDPEREDLKLSFDWLLEKGGKKKTSPSLLQKWARAFFNLGAKSVGDASLQTHRQPDNLFSNALEGELLIIERIPSEVWAEICKQLDGEEKAIEFLSNFKFTHSQKPILDLEATLFNQISPEHTTETGWLRLLSQVWKWSMLENEPGGDGCIRFCHLTNIIKQTFVRVIPQEFFIPEGYSPPDEDFHEEIKNFSLNREKEKTKVIWGPPGSGKSTYLAYLNKEFESSGFYTIRHHYFLSLRDDTIGRWHYNTVAGSLLHQLWKAFPSLEKPTRDTDELRILRHNLERAGGLARTKGGKPLVIIIDGLDHVWRESQENHALVALFDELLPLPENVLLLVGTQRISDEKIPSRLLSEAPKDKWVELPLLGLNAVVSWLEVKLKEIDHGYKDDDDAILRLATTFQKQSGGNPLYLIYSFNQISNEKNDFTSSDIKSLPGCPDGDINDYYEYLWQALSIPARELLFLFTVAEFQWPDENGLIECLGGSQEYLKAYYEIGHLLDCRPLGIFPFHSSILVNVAKKPEFEAARNRLLPKIISWLKTKAPKHLKWGWEWIVSSKLPTPPAFIKKISRDWVAKSFAQGESLNQIERILITAEKVALENGEFDQLVRIRSIKTRFVNADYYGEDFELLELCGCAISEDKFVLLRLLHDLQNLTENELLSASRLGKKIDQNIPQACLNEANRRLILAHKFGRNLFEENELNPELIAKLAALSPEAKLERIIPFSLQFSHSAVEVMDAFCEEAIRNKEASKCLKLVDIVFGLEEDLIKKAIKANIFHPISEMAIRASIMEGANLVTRRNFEILRGYPLASCFSILKNITLTKPPLFLPVEFDQFDYSINQEVYRDHFFASLWTAMFSTGDFEFIPRKNEKDKNGFIESFFSTLDKTAFLAAKELTRGKPLNPLRIFELFEEIFPWVGGESFDQRQRFGVIMHTLPLIGFDLALISGWQPGKFFLDHKNIKAVEKNKWWNWEIWTEHIVFLGVQITDRKAFFALIKNATETLVENFEYLSELAIGYTKLALFSFHSGFNREASNFIQKAILNFMGYSDRKDMKLGETLDAIEFCADHGRDVSGWLKRVEPFVLNILEFTDGKETRWFPEQYYELIAKLFPKQLFRLYHYEFERENFSGCEDILKLLARTGDLRDAKLIALLKTVPTQIVFHEIQTRADEGDLEAKNLHEELLKFWGGLPYESPKPSYSKFEKVSVPLKPEDFKPQDLEKLLVKLNTLDRGLLGKDEHYDISKFLQDWFAYWHKKNKSSQILGSVRNNLKKSSRGHSEVESNLDTIFEISLEYEGKEAAFEWLVLSHRLNHGWSPYFTRNSKGRILKAAEIYPDKWREYILQTSEPKDEYWGRKYGLSIGQDLLVLFLSKAGQEKLAEEVTEALVKQVEEDVANLDFQKFAWLK